MAGVTRRDFFKHLAACGCATGAIKIFNPMTSVAWAVSASCGTNNKILVHLWLDGGLDAASFLVPRTVQAYADKRPTVHIANPTVISSLYGLHPSLTNITTLYNQGKVAIVNKVGYPQPIRSHPDSKAVYSRATRDPKLVTTGWIGRFADTYCAHDPFSIFSLRGLGIDLKSSRYVGATVNNLADAPFTNDYPAGPGDDLDRRGTIVALRGMEQPANGAQQSLIDGWPVADQVSAQAAVITSAYSSGITYPNPQLDNALGSRFRDAAMLIKHDENPSIIGINQGGYDVHDTAVAGNAANFSKLDAAIGAFIADLTAMGRVNDVMILIESEFGRASVETIPDASGNRPAGLDHGHGTLSILIGPNLGGGIYGDQFVESDFTDKRWLDSSVDFREIRWQVLAHHLGVDPTPIFPEAFANAGLVLFT